MGELNGQHERLVPQHDCLIASNAGSARMTPIQQSEHHIALLREQVTEQMAALTVWLRATMRRAQYNERCIVLVNGERYW